MKNKSLQKIIILLSALLLLSACGKTETEVPEETPTETAVEETAVASASPELTEEREESDEGAEELTEEAKENSEESEEPAEDSEEEAKEQSEESEENPDESGLTASLRITELMSSNQSSIKNEAGERLDWLEIENLGTENVNLEGCWLSDDAQNPQKWAFPAIELDVGERIVVFCSEEENETQDLQANFALNKKGGELLLSTPLGEPIDSVSYEKMAADASVIFSSDGEKLEEPEVTFLATPGFPNTAKGYKGYLKAADQHGALVINEVVTYNESYSEQHHKYYDWLELKNVSSDSILLSNYYLSDDGDDLQKTRLPGKELKAGETFLVFCSGDSSLSTKTLCHADFSIGSEEHLYLTEVDGSLSDELYLHDVPLNGSIGRMDGKNGFWYFAAPSPEKNNSGGYREISQAPTASVEQGAFSVSETFTVELTAKGDIYYTLDGSVPDETDSLYLNPIEVSETTILRAVSIEKGKMVSPPCTYSYILNEDDSLPVTSLVCDPKDMFGSSGVYSAPREEDAKCDANVTFFDTNGDGFSAGCSVELHGANSRKTFAKKSFELKFSSRYGGDVEYDLFQDGNVTEFHSLLLRGGSSVKMDTVRDCFVSKLMYDVSPELYPQDVRYTAVYINGEYYGIYAWREAYSEEYFESHTGADKDDVEIVRGPLSGTSEMCDILNYISNRGTLSSEEYQYVSERLDLSSVARWFAVEAYFNNQDINGNIRYVKTGENAKWQVILYDLDYCCLDATPGWSTALDSYQLGDIVVKTLLRNADFRRLLLEECAQLYQNGFTTEHIQAVYDELLLPLDDESVEKDCERWDNDFTKWGRYTKAMRNNMNDSRMVDWLGELKELTKATKEEMHEYFPEYY